MSDADELADAKVFLAHLYTGLEQMEHGFDGSLVGVERLAAMLVEWGPDNATAAELVKVLDSLRDKLRVDHGFVKTTVDYMRTRGFTPGE